MVLFLRRLLLTLFLSVPMMAYPASEDILTDDEPIFDEEKALSPSSSLAYQSDSPQQKASSQTNDTDGMFGSFRVGPMAGFGLVMGPNFTIETKINRYLGASVGVGGYNHLSLLQFGRVKDAVEENADEYEVNTLNLSYMQYEGRLLVYPFGGAFFLGSALGYREISLESSATIFTTVSGYGTVTAPADIDFTIYSTYVTPQIGWMGVWSGAYGGFAIGTELGVQLNLSARSHLHASVNTGDPALDALVLSSPEYQDLYDQINNDALDRFKNIPLPYWNVIKVGWLF